MTEVIRCGKCEVVDLIVDSIIMGDMTIDQASRQLVLAAALDDTLVRYDPLSPNFWSTLASWCVLLRFSEPQRIFGFQFCTLLDEEFRLTRVDRSQCLVETARIPLGWKCNRRRSWALRQGTCFFVAWRRMPSEQTVTLEDCFRWQSGAPLTCAPWVRPMHVFPPHFSPAGGGFQRKNRWLADRHGLSLQRELINGRNCRYCWRGGIVCSRMKVIFFCRIVDYCSLVIHREIISGAVFYESEGRSLTFTEYNYCIIK